MRRSGTQGQLGLSGSAQAARGCDDRMKNEMKSRIEKYCGLQSPSYGPVSIVVAQAHGSSCVATLSLGTIDGFSAQAAGIIWLTEEVERHYSRQMSRQYGVELRYGGFR